MRRRRRRTYKSGFSGALTLLTLLVVLSISELTTAIWPASSWPWPAGPAWVNYLAAAVLAAVAGLLYARQRRSRRWKSRQQLREAAAARSQGTWLNRDEHQAFSVDVRWWPWCRLLLITRIAEDNARELDREQGEVPLPMETFAILPFTLDVLRHDVTVLIDPDKHTARELPGPGALRSAWRLHKTSKRTGLGFVSIDPAEIAEVVAQLQASEPLGNPEGGA